MKCRGEKQDGDLGVIIVNESSIPFVAVFGCHCRARECAVRTNSFSDESQSSCKSNKNKPQDLLHPSENMRTFSTTFDSRLISQAFTKKKESKRQTDRQNRDP
jgi:hypothetical protein